MNLSVIQAERAQVERLRKMHAVDAALRTRAHCRNMDVQQWVEEIGPDLFDLIVAEECETHGVDVKEFEAWYIDPDPAAQAAHDMGATP